MIEVNKHQGTVDAVNAFCAANATILATAVSMEIGGQMDSSIQEVDTALSGFGACANVVVDGLNLLATVYPPIAGMK
jgi:hypothetical protein